MIKMPSSTVSLLAIFLLFMAFMGGAIAMLVFPIQPSLVSSGVVNKTPTVNVTLYGGEINLTRYGFGLNSSTLSSPGPTLSFNMSDVVKVTFINSGRMPHGFAIADANRTGSTQLFGAAIGSASNPIAPGQSGSVVFQPTAVGSSFYYICPVPGHPELGMWGHVTIASG